MPWFVLIIVKTKLTYPKTTNSVNDTATIRGYALWNEFVLPSEI